MRQCVWRLAAAVAMAVTLPYTTHAQAGRICRDRAARCQMWASHGACITQASEMSAICPFSCRICDPAVTALTSVLRPAVGADASPPRAPPRPGGGGGTFPAPGVRPRPTGFSPVPSLPRSSITRPNFECGGLDSSSSSSSNTRRARDANPQVPPSSSDDAQKPDAPPVDKSKPETQQPFCGATPISENFLLTAATCVIQPDRPVYSVRLGELDFTQSGEANSRPVDYAIKQIIVHPEFNPSFGARYNDVALLETVVPIAFNKYVFPYCLSDETLAPKTLVTGSGFGHVNETHKAGHLQEAELEVLPTKACEDTYKEAGQEQRLRAAYPSLLQKRDVICAGYPGRGACKGDEGGPLFRESEGRRYLVGIISFTGPCSKNSILPGVYTDVAYHIPFINSVLYGF